MDAAKTVNVTFGIDAAPNIFGAPLTATIPAGTPYTLTLTALDSDDVPAARVMTVTSASNSLSFSGDLAAVTTTGSSLAGLD